MWRGHGTGHIEVNVRIVTKLWTSAVERSSSPESKELEGFSFGKQPKPQQITDGPFERPEPARATSDGFLSTRWLSKPQRSFVLERTEAFLPIEPGSSTTAR